MEEGDFVITPPWTWHDHVNDSDAPTIWLHGLDIPLVRFFDTSFAEGYPEEEQPITVPNGQRASAQICYRSIINRHHLSRLSLPILTHEPVKHWRSRQRNEWDPCHGLKMRYANPNDGGHAIPTIGAFIQLLPKGFEGRYRATDATVFVCVEGAGTSKIGRRTFDWGPRDIFIAPSWHPVAHKTTADSVLFSFSDRPVQEKRRSGEKSAGKHIQFN